MIWGFNMFSQVKSVADFGENTFVPGHSCVKSNDLSGISVKIALKGEVRCDR